MNAGAVRLQRGVALFEDFKRKAAAGQRAARPLRELAIGVVGIGDAAFGVVFVADRAGAGDAGAGVGAGAGRFVAAVGGLALVVGGRLLLTPSGRRAAEV